MGGALDQYSAIQRYMYVSATVLSIYDHLLLFDDEVRYFWKVRQPWIFCPYFLYRGLAIGFQFWRVYFIILAPGGPNFIYTADRFTQLIVLTIFFAYSDGFVTLRTYAITFRNKILTTYLVTLSLARFILSVTGFLILGSHNLQNATISIGTTFEVSAFAIVVWHIYRNKDVLKIAGVVRAIVSQATIYFIVIAVLQVFTQIALNFAEPDHAQSFLLAIFGFIYPSLTIRCVISLRKSVDPEGEQTWKLEHLTSIDFTSYPPVDTQYSAACETVEIDPVGASPGWIHVREPQGPMMEVG